VRKPWQRQESRLANLTGGSVNAGSGNGWVRKADVRAKSIGHLIEAKWTAHRSFTLKLTDLKVLAHHAAIEGRTPAFCIEFQESLGGGHHRTSRYVVLQEEDYFGDDPHLPLRRGVGDSTE
jgi:hypothetical protein